MLLNYSVGEDSWESLELQVHPKGDQSWVFIAGADVVAETPILWPSDAKRWLVWKDLDAGKDWVQEEKGTTEEEMVGWHHWLNGHGFGWTPGVGDGQGGLACCIPWGCKESDTTEQLNWTELKVEWLHFSTCFLILVFLCQARYQLTVGTFFEVSIYCMSLVCLQTIVMRYNMRRLCIYAEQELFYLLVYGKWKECVCLNISNVLIT